MKRCTSPACRRWLPLAAFHVDRSKPDGRKSRCAECVNAAARKPGGRGAWPGAGDELGGKVCTGCRRRRPLAALGQRTGRHRRTARCKRCRAAEQRARNARAAA